MRFLQIIPIHNYFEGVARLASFAHEFYFSLFGAERFRVVLVDSGSASFVKAQLFELGNQDGFMVASSQVAGSLKDALLVGFQTAESFVPDVVHVSETDASPNIDVLQTMLRLYTEELGSNVGSVSPMYTWLGRYCYPTHRHWHSDPLYKSHDTIGPISDVGRAGVPFLYSLWNPKVFTLIGNPNFRPLLHLDSDFGAEIHALGYRHLRIKRAFIEHVGGGRQSRRSATR